MYYPIIGESWLQYFDLYKVKTYQSKFYQDFERESFI